MLRGLHLDKVLSKFKWKRLAKVAGGGHDARIGEWIRWWNEGNLDHMVINPAPKTEIQGKPVFADLLFLEKKNAGAPNLLNVVGVAEIENNREKFLEKLNSLRAYIDNKKKYPDLEFALLSVSWYRDLEKEQYEKTFEKVLQTLKDFSESSTQSWILHAIKYVKLTGEQAPYSIKIIDKAPGAESFFYTHRNLRGVEWLTFKNGEYSGAHARELTL